jgi:hypothetical protein
MAKDTFYFSHDYNSRNDDKIKRLIRKHSMEGYGVFWAIVEDLYNNANALPYDCEGIAYDLRVDEKIVYSVLNDFDLFIFENGKFGSNSIANRLDCRKEKSIKARESAHKRWNSTKTDANALQTQSEGNAIKERKVKERKLKENIINTNTTLNLLQNNIIISSDEFEKLKNEYSQETTENAIKYLSNYKLEKNYKTKSDYLTIKRWVIDAVKKQNNYNGINKNGTAEKEPTFGGFKQSEVERFFGAKLPSGDGKNENV